MGQGTNLRSLREAAGLSQGALSDRCKEAGAAISQSRISEYESGSRFPRPDNARVLALALGVTPEAVYGALLAQRAEEVA